MKLFKNIILISFLVLTTTIGGRAKSAENLYLYYGMFSRSISIEDIKSLAETKKAYGTLSNIIKLTNNDEKIISEMLNQEIEAPLVLTSKLLNSKIGNAIIEKAIIIIYPNRYKHESISKPALRSAIIKAIRIGNEKINIINFLEAYPNKNVAINLTELYKTISKVESISELVKFFSNSPLEKLKEGSSKT